MKRCRKHQWGPWHSTGVVTLWKTDDRSGYQRVCLKCPAYQQTREVAPAGAVRTAR